MSRAWAATHAGTIRPINQDAMLCRPELGLFAVADGVGGHGDGEAASQAVVDALAALPGHASPEDRLKAIRVTLKQVHGRLLETGATTVVVLLLHENHYACLWVGDSRCYLLRESRLLCLTTDHSVVQELVSAGGMTEAEAEMDPRRNMITRAIGAGRQAPVVDKVIGSLMAKDRFLLCSDGLYKTVKVGALIEGLPLQANPAALLVEAALSGGARDNVTAVIVDHSARHGLS